MGAKNNKNPPKGYPQVHSKDHNFTSWNGHFGKPQEAGSGASQICPPSPSFLDPLEPRAECLSGDSSPVPCLVSPFYPHCAPFLLSVVSYDPQFCLCRFTPRGSRGRQCSITPIDGSTAPLRRAARALSLVPQVWPRPSLWPDFTESMSHPWLQFSVIRGSLQNAELQLHLKMCQDAPHPLTSQHIFSCPCMD